jgi:TolB-like protein
MGTVKTEYQIDQGLTADQILQQMERVLASPEFRSPDRGRKFLRFIVTETLAGRSQFLKAFTIANEIFGRKSSFDAQNDPVVRIEAGRIRRELERYYLVAGQTDAIMITIPKGGYVPHFGCAKHPRNLLPLSHSFVMELPSRLADGRRWRWTVPIFGLICLLAAISYYLSPIPNILAQRRDPIEAPAAKSPEPIIVVDLFQSDGPDSTSSGGAQGMRDEVIGQLAKFDDIIVVADPSKASLQSLVGYTLQGNVQRDGNRLRSMFRLVRRSDAAVIWARNYDSDLGIKGILQIQADIGQDIAIAVAQPYSAIFVTDTAQPSQSSPSEDIRNDCTSTYYIYRRTMDQQSHLTARSCLQRATERFPKSATSWARLSLIYLDELRFRYKLAAEPSLNAVELAAIAAANAMEIDPRDARALQATMLVGFFNNDIDKAVKAGAAAYAANANDTEVVGEYGLRLAMSGKWQTGCELISKAVNKDAGPKGYYEVGMALCALMRNDLQAAELWSRMCDLDYNPMHRLVLLSILGAEGKTIEAEQERTWLNNNAPDLMKNVRREVSLRLQRPEDQERFLGGLRSLGVLAEATIPQASDSN